MKTIPITVVELREMLAELKGTAAVSFVTETQKKIAPHGLVVKNALVTALIGFHYDKSMNRALEKAGEIPNHISQHRKWGERIVGTPLVRYGEKYYLESKVTSISGVAYRSLDGKLLNNIKEPKDEKLVVLRDFDLNSLKSIKLQGQEYEITK